MVIPCASREPPILGIDAALTATTINVGRRHSWPVANGADAHASLRLFDATSEHLDQYRSATAIT